MEIEKCVVCGDDTPYTKETHVDFRNGYIEEIGQLCRFCYNDVDRKHVAIPTKIITDTPNDQELGKKVRQFYFESQK
jgi:hypothetical protein